MNTLPDPQLRHVYRLDAELDAPVDLGDTPHGHRRIIPLTRGHAAGPYFDAELLPAGGADWQIVRASGSSVADIRYTLKTDGGALLYVRSNGIVAVAIARELAGCCWEITTWTPDRDLVPPASLPAGDPLTHTASLPHKHTPTTRRRLTNPR